MPSAMPPASVSRNVSSELRQSPVDWNAVWLRKLDRGHAAHGVAAEKRIIEREIIRKFLQSNPYPPKKILGYRVENFLKQSGAAAIDALLFFYDKVAPSQQHRALLREHAEAIAAAASGDKECIRPEIPDASAKEASASLPSFAAAEARQAAPSGESDKPDEADEDDEEDEDRAVAARKSSPVSGRKAEELLGHASSKTTEIYAHVAAHKIVEIRSPIAGIMKELKQRPTEISPEMYMGAGI
jgi:hypothetical protein